MKKNEGITLIALIITIIILIILTAITISNVMNANLFGLAKGAAENYIQAGKEEGSAINEIMNTVAGIENGGEGAGGGTTPQETLEVKLKVEEEKVTGDTIPISLETLKGEEKVENVTYTAYLQPEGENEQEGVQITGDTHTFGSLDETKDYTIRVVASSQDGVQGENKVTVKALAIKYQTTYNVFQMVYRRYTDGMTWREWVESGYNHSIDEGIVLSIVTSNAHDFGMPDHQYCLGITGAKWIASNSTGAVVAPNGVVWLENHPSGIRHNSISQIQSVIYDFEAEMPYCHFPYRTNKSYSDPSKPELFVEYPDGYYASTEESVDVHFDSLDILYPLL